MNMRIEIDGNYIRESKRPNDLFLNIFKGKKLMKIYDMETAKSFVKWYNKTQSKKDLCEDENFIMTVEGRPVYVGNKLLYNTGNGQYIVREIFPQHKLIAHNNPDWVRCWSWDLKDKN